MSLLCILLVIFFFIAIALTVAAGAGWMFYLIEHNTRLDMEEELAGYRRQENGYGRTQKLS